MPVKFCAQCGTELTLRLESGRQRPTCPRCGFIVYRNPVPVAVVSVVSNSRLLLVRRRNAPLAGYWAPPAGYVEIDESLEDGAAREVKEETGLDVRIGKLERVYSRANVGVILLMYSADLAGGELVPAEDEVSEARFFSLSELPPCPEPTNPTGMERLFFELLADFFTQMRNQI